MCLVITEPRKIKSDIDGLCVGWKILTIDNKSPYYGKNPWKVGEVLSDRTSNTLTASEEKTQAISNGIHVFQTRKDARIGIGVYKRWMGSSAEKIKLVKVYFWREDIVAFGCPESFWPQTRNIVLTKITIKSLKAVR